MSIDAADAFFAIFGLYREDDSTMIDMRHTPQEGMPDVAVIEKLNLFLAREETNRNLIRGLCQRVDALERGAVAPPPAPSTNATRPEDV